MKLLLPTICLVGLFLTLNVKAGDQVVAPKPVARDLQNVDRLAYEGKMVEALAEVENCETFFQKELDSASPTPEGQLFSIDPVTSYSQLVSASMIYKAQILARVGEADKARATLMESPYFRAAHGLGGFLYSPVDSLENTTDGYIYEIEGNTGRALEKYLQAKNYGRAALIELAMHEDLRAKNLAEMGAIDKDPTAFFALGTICELEKTPALAYYYYLEAQKEIEAARRRSNPIAPLFFFERQKIENALARIPAAASLPSVGERDGHKAYFDATGKIIGWERWPGALFSERIKLKQDEYNQWITTVNHASTHPFIHFVPQYPRHFSGNSDSKPISDSLGQIQEMFVPLHIQPTGVLDLDTLAIGFYKSAVEWSELCARSGINPDQLSTPIQLGDLDSKPDESLGMALRWHLWSSYARLNRWRDFLSGVRMTTSSGTVLDAVQETFRYEECKRELENKVTAFSFNNSAYLKNGIIPDKFLNTPPDFITAHISPTQLTPTFIHELRSREQTTRASLFLARQLLSQ